MTIGSVSRVSSRSRPGIRARASIYPTDTPRTRAMAVAYTATFSDRARAIQTDSIPEPSGLLETEPGKNCLAGWRLYVGDETLRFVGMGAVGHPGNRVADGPIERHDESDFDCVYSTGIGGVNETGCHLAARHVIQGLTHVLSGDRLGLQSRPVACRMQRLLTVTTDRHAGRVADGDLLHVCLREVCEGVEIQLAGTRYDHHQIVGGEVPSRAWINQLPLCRLIHGFLVGGGEHIHRRALGDLLQQ